MAINANATTETRESIPAGNYIARCYSMIELGSIPENYQGVTKVQPKVRITWELPMIKKVFDESKGEQPLVISKEYTISLADKSNLRKDLVSWRGVDFTPDQLKSFDITKVIGAACMINIIHKKGVSDPNKIYESITSITPMPSGMVCPPMINPRFELSYDNFQPHLFDSLPEFIRTKMISSMEYSAMMNPAAHTNNHVDPNPNDDVPF